MSHHDHHHDHDHHHKEHEKHHSHGHHHGHHGEEHEHSHEAQKPLSERDKLARMFEHWLQHNEDHARSYEDWADRARAMQEPEALQLLLDMAASTRGYNDRLAKVVEKLKG